MPARDFIHLTYAEADLAREAAVHATLSMLSGSRLVYVQRPRTAHIGRVRLHAADDRDLRNHYAVAVDFKRSPRCRECGELIEDGERVVTLRFTSDADSELDGVLHATYCPTPRAVAS